MIATDPTAAFNAANPLFTELRDLLPGYGFGYRATPCPVCQADGARFGKLAIRPQPGGRIALRCRSGCAVAAIVAALPVSESLRARVAAVADADEPHQSPQEATEPDKATEMPRAPFKRITEVIAMPPLSWRVEGAILNDSFAAIVGPSASFKSFVALDLALSVATGRAWAGRAVERGPVVYVAAEGYGGTPWRLRAWLASRGHAAEDVPLHFVAKPLNLLNPIQFEQFRADLAGLEARPALIVFDTFARVTPGSDENSAAGIGQFVAACDELRAATGATILVIHHSGKSSTGIRGSSALEQSFDTVIEARRNGDRLTLRCTKQKDNAEFEPIGFEATPVQFDAHTSSLVLDLAAAQDEGGDRPSAPKERAALDALRGLGGPATFTQWREASKIPKTTLLRIVAALVDTGQVVKEGEGKSTRYRSIAG